MKRRIIKKINHLVDHKDQILIAKTQTDLRARVGKETKAGKVDLFLPNSLNYHFMSQ